MLDTQMTNFMTGATQKLNKIEKEKYLEMYGRSTESWEWYSITCPCGNPFAYRPMIQSGIHGHLSRTRIPWRGTITAAERPVDP